ncbi:MAG: glyoxalase [Frankiales bacterium]|nr:glyoxalase [Frankiales bacterium]
MSLEGLELHHAAVRMSPAAVDETLHLYQDVLGLRPDPGTRRIPGIPGTWLDADDDAQLHLFAVEGTSEYATSPERDPFRPHVAFGVPSIEAALAELSRLEVDHWTAGRGERRQAFLSDASGNMVELHQTGTCRCRRRDRPGAPA